MFYLLVDVAVNFANTIIPGLVAEENEVLVPLEPQSQESKNVSHCSDDARTFWMTKAIDRFAKERFRVDIQKLSGDQSVKSKQKQWQGMFDEETHPSLKQGLDVKGLTIGWYQIHEFICMTLKPLSICVDVAVKEALDQEPGMFPLFSVNRADTFVCKGEGGLVVAPSRRHSKIFPDHCRHGLNILGLDGVDESRAGKVDEEGLGLILVDFIEPDEVAVLTQRLGHSQNEVQAKDGISVWVIGNLATAQELSLPVVVDRVRHGVAC